MASGHSKRSSKDKIVLMYHDVFNDTCIKTGFNTKGADYYKVSIEQFESQLDAIACLISEKKILPDDVLLTFDDGGVSAHEIITPVLERYGFKGHFFIVSELIGMPGFMSENQILDLLARGHMIGSHSATHPSRFESLSTEERKQEWKISLERLNSLSSNTIKEISIPNGYFVREDVGFLKDLGVEVIYHSSYGDNYHENRICIQGRVAVTSKTSMTDIIKFFTCKNYRRLYICKNRCLHFLKRILGDNYLTIKKLIRNYI